MRIALRAPLAAALLLLTPALVSAQGVGKICKADQEKFCPGMKSGDGKLGPCMKQHEAELSAECSGARKAAQEAQKNIRMNCKADTEKLCAESAKGPGQTVKCLQSHISELGQACANALKSRPGAKQS